MCRTMRVQKKTKSTISRLTVRGKGFHLNNHLTAGVPTLMRLKPVADDEVRRPVAGMAITAVAEEFDLRGLQCPGFGNRRRAPQLAINLGNQRGRGLVVHEP